MGTVKYTGPVASFHCPTNAEIRSLKVHFSPKQLGEGDPSPENVRPIEGWDGVEQYYSGKNMGHIVGYSAITLSNPHNKKSVTNNYGTTLSTVNPERSVIITQSQIQDASNIGSYKNGYMAIELDNLIFDTPYDISFKVTNITSNPLNATLQNLGLGIPNGTRRGPTEIRDNILIYKNFPFNQRDIYPNQIDFDLRICGMSFTLSDFMVTPANTNDGVYEPYTQNRIVKWNQWLPTLNDENWQAYNSNYINTTFENGVATSTWLTNNSGYQASVRTKNGVLQKNKEIWYLSYMLKTSMSGGSWGAEFNGGLQNTSVYNLEANIWTRCSECSIYWRGTRNHVYISYYRGGIDEHTGMVAQVKSPIFINLTQMFGAGNEPTKEEFEEQCALNGIDLTSNLPYDEGSIREWKTNGALLKNSIIFPVLGKNKFNINAPFAEPSNTSSSSSVARIFQPYTYCLGLSVGNNYLPDRITDFSISNNTLTFSTINISYGVGFAIPLQPGSYRMTYTGENVTRTLVCYNNEGNTIATNIDSQGIFYINPKVSIAVIIFRSSTANTPTTVSNIQIEKGITSTEYEEFNPNHTVYGGWVDLISGEVVSTYLYCKIKDLPGEWNYRSGNNRFQITLTGNYANVASSGTWTNFAISEAYATSTSNGYGNKQIATYIDKHIYIRDDDFEGDVEAFLNGVGDTYVTYELAESTTYLLSPTSMQTFLSYNNIWSNADYVEVEYDLHETQNILARKQFIVANQPHIVKPAAAPLQNFVTDMAVPLKECKVEFKPIQDLHGYDKPWVGGSGKNLFNINATEQNPSDTTSANTTLRIFTVGTYAVGTSWNNWWQPTQIISYSINNNILTIQNNNVYGIGFAFKLTPEATYTISATSTNGGINVSYYDVNGNYITTNSSNILNTAFTVPAEADITLLTFFSRTSSKTATFTNIQLEEGSTATSYEPYENICPIEGWEKIQIGLPSEYTRVEYIGTGNNIPYIDTGIYLTDELETEIHYYNDKLEAYLFGARVSTAASPFCNFNIESTYNRSRFDYGNQKGNTDNTRYNNMHDGEFQFTFHNRIGTLTDLTLSTSKEVIYDRETCVFQPFTTHTLLLFAVYNSAKSTILTSKAPGDFNIYSAKFWIGGKLIRNFIPCIRKSDNKAGMYDTVSKSFFTSQNSSEFISGAELEEHSLLIDWSDSTGTMYGGYVDLVRGEIVAEWIAFDMTQLSLQQFSTGTSVNTISAFPETIKSRNAMYCNILTPMSNPNVLGIEGIDWNNGRVNICLSVSRGLDSQSKIEQWLNDLKNNGTTPLIVANMSTPIIYSIDPITLKTLRGQNNIWSDSNDNIEIKYWKH